MPNDIEPRRGSHFAPRTSAQSEQHIDRPAGTRFRGEPQHEHAESASRARVSADADAVRDRCAIVLPQRPTIARIMRGHTQRTTMTIGAIVIIVTAIVIAGASSRRLSPRCSWCCWGPPGFAAPCSTAMPRVCWPPRKRCSTMRARFPTPCSTATARRHPPRRTALWGLFPPCTQLWTASPGKPRRSCRWWGRISDPRAPWFLPSTRSAQEALGPHGRTGWRHQALGHHVRWCHQRRPDHPRWGPRCRRWLRSSRRTPR